MKKFIFGLFCLLCINFATISQAQPIDQQQVKEAMQKAYSSSVALFSITEDGVGRCTGTIIKSDPKETVVITAKHCISIMTTEMYADNVLVEKYVIDIDKDLALLYLESPIKNKTAIQVSELYPFANDRVFIVAYPDWSPYIEPGFIKILGKKDGYLDLPVISGCSGGGLFNENGQLVGVIWGKIRFSDTSIFTQLQEVKRFLKDNNIKVE